MSPSENDPDIPILYATKSISSFLFFLVSSISSIMLFSSIFEVLCKIFTKKVKYLFIEKQYPKKRTKKKKLFLIQYLKIPKNFNQRFHQVIKVDKSFYISVTLQAVVQEITVLFVIDLVFSLYCFLTTSISVVCISIKIVPIYLGIVGFQICFYKVLQSFRF